MNLIQRFIGVFKGENEKKSFSLSDSSAFEIFGTPPTVSGATIGPSSALRVPAVNLAIALISGAIGSLPAKVYCPLAAADSNDGKRVAKDHPAYRFVHDEANDWQSAGELRKQLTRDALLHNQGGFAFVNRVNGRVVELLRLDPTTVTVKADETTGEPVYEVREGNRARRYGFTDILHIRSPLDIAPINAGREAIGLASILEKHGAHLFAGGARPAAVIEKEGSFTGRDDGVGAIANLKKMWRAWRANETTDPLILDQGAKYKPVTMTSVDAQFLEMRVEQVREIARIFQVPPTMLFELSRGTWSNTEQMYQSFLTLTLRPWLGAWTWAYARVLLSPEERAEGYYVEFVIDDLVTADAATRANVYAQFRAMGAMTANEVRAGLNMPPMDGGDVLANPYTTSFIPPTNKPAGENDNSKNDKDTAA